MKSVLNTLAFFGILLLASCENEDVTQATVTLKTNVKLTIGNVLYDNLDATITINGLDANHQKKWSETNPYTGPTDNALQVKAGYHYYTIEINKWGITDQQTLTAAELWNGRADGPAPVTYVLGGSSQAKKLKYYTESYELPGLDFQPQLKVEYEYNLSGKLSRYTVSGYNPESEQFEEQHYFVFSHDDNLHVSKIEEFLPGDDSPYVEYTYSYLPNGTITGITKSNYATGINSELNFSYDLGNKKIKAAYTFSNGGAFEYEFLYNKNILSDRTTRDAQLCSDGEYSYDKGINPFKHLGYVDYTLINFSYNNKLAENVNYVACGFPSLIPQSFSHEYDSKGYPIVSTTFYNSGKSKKEFYYE
jgi:hypothetical protein